MRVYCPYTQHWRLSDINFHIVGSFNELTWKAFSLTKIQQRTTPTEGWHNSYGMAQICVCMCIWGVVFPEKKSCSLNFSQWEWYIFLPSKVTFIFLLKLHLNSTLEKLKKFSLNMQNSVHKALYGCPVMYFWDMQIWHFFSVIALQAQLSLLLFFSLSSWGEASPAQLWKHYSRLQHLFGAAEENFTVIVPYFHLARPLISHLVKTFFYSSQKHPDLWGAP